jgi:hypothetical protein
MFGKIISKISGEISGNISDNIPTIKKVNDCNINQTTSDTTDEVEQYAQKCAWCGRHLIGAPDAQFAKYNGPDKRYRHWICHEECNIPLLRLDTEPHAHQIQTVYNPVLQKTEPLKKTEPPLHLDEILFTRNRSHVLMYTIPEEPHRLISSDSRTQSPDIQP